MMGVSNLQLFVRQIRCFEAGEELWPLCWGPKERAALLGQLTQTWLCHGAGSMSPLDAVLPRLDMASHSGG